MQSRFKSVCTPALIGDNPVKRAFRHLCRNVKSPLAERMNRSNDRDLIHMFDIDPSEYLDATSFRNDYLLVSYLSKYKGLNTGIDTEAKALSGFATGESICKSTNARFRAGKPSIVDPALCRAQYLIAKALGVFDIRKLDGQERWGPGATYELARTRAHLDTKIAEFPISVTAECLPSFRRAIQNDLHWSYIVLGTFPEGPYSLIADVFSVVSGSRIVTVPKNAKTDRTIAIEPRGNMFMQKAAGRYIRNVLKRVGISLDDQGVNQNLARDALKLDLATIDLSMASDTISRQLVFELLPLEWALYLDSIRSKFYELNGEIRQFEKFSSMGNGFTFELESLIFWALAKASMIDEQKEMSVYGDDIIVPCSDAHTLITTLSYCGFSTNASKTFVEGPFRESCGRHYFNNEDVTPIYQKEIVNDQNSHIRFLNRLKRYAVKHHDGDSALQIVNSVWKKLFDPLKKAGWHPQIPVGTEGDDAYVVGHSDVDLSEVPYNRNYGYKWHVSRRTVKRIPADESALLAYALRQGGSLASHPKGWGEIDSTDECAVAFVRATRRIEPTWEFALN